MPAAADAKSPSASGTLQQLKGAAGCVGAPSARLAGCATARGLKGPGPFMGSRAIAVSPDGNNVYIASSTSNAIAIFDRDKSTGVLAQPRGDGGCIASGGGGGCARAVGLDGANSVAVSADGRNVYATARDSSAVTAFERNRKTGALRQLPGGCLSGLPLPGCTTGEALVAPDVVVVSHDGRNVYAGAFFGNAVATFTRDASGALTQPAGAAGCIAESNPACAPGIALGAVEGLAIRGDGSEVYTGSALSNAVAILTRDTSTGTLAQATDGSGCIVDAPLTGCITGVQLAGANAVALSPGDKQAYVTSLFSNSVTSFNHGTLTQKQGTTGCLVFLRAVGCSFGRAMSAPEGLVVAPDGRNVYVAAFSTGAIDVLTRNRVTGRILQKPGRPGCLAARRRPGCAPARALRGISSIAISPDGRFVYSTSFASNAVDVFRRRG